MKNMRLYNIQYTHTLVSNKKALQREFVKRRVYGVDVTTLNLLYIYIYIVTVLAVLWTRFSKRKKKNASCILSDSLSLSPFFYFVLLSISLTDLLCLKPRNKSVSVSSSRLQWNCQDLSQVVFSLATFLKF